MDINNMNEFFAVDDRFICKKQKPTPSESSWIGFQLKKRRNELKLTLKEAASKIGVTPRTLMQWENCHKFPSFFRLHQTALAYDCTFTIGLKKYEC